MTEEYRLMFGYDNWVVGGVEKVLINLMTYLSQRYKVYLIIPRINKKLNYLSVPESIELIEIDKMRSMSEEMVKICEDFRANLFIGSGNLNCDQLQIYKMLHEKGIKTIMFNHYAWFFPYQYEIFMSKTLKIRNEVLKYPDVVLFLTSLSAILCSKNCNREVVTLPNPNNYPSQDYIPFSERSDIVLSVARFDDKEKRLDKILSVFSKVYKKNPKAILVIVGKVDYKKAFGKDLKEELKRLHLPDSSVRIMGIQKNVLPYYKQAKVFLFASECEGFGLVFGEAGICGLPCVANYFLGIEDIITEGKNGYFFKNHESEDKVSEQIIDLLTNEKTWTVLSRNSVEMARRFDQKFILSKWEELIQIVLCNERQSIEEKLKNTNFLIERDLTHNEISMCLEEYENVIDGAIGRLNRCDDAQDYLNSLYLSEKSNNLFEVSNETLIQEIKKRIKRKLLKYLH